MTQKETPLRLALVGCADGIDALRNAAARLRGATFAAAIDSNADTARAMAEVAGASLVLTSFEEALALHQDAFDAVVVRTPLSERGATACRAADAGKHVLVEAPVGVSRAETERVLEISRQKATCAMVGGSLRFFPGYQTILTRVSEGKLGTPGLLRVHRWSPSREPEADAGGDPEPGLAEAIAGDVELAIHIFGAQPTRVYAIERREVGTGAGVRPLPGYLQLHFGFPEGAMAVLDFATTLPSGRGYDSLHVIGSCGAAYADDHHNTHLLYRGGDPRAQISGQGNLHSAWELQEFVDAVSEQRSPAVTIEQACVTHRVIEAVLQSLDSGVVLHLDGDVYRASSKRASSDRTPNERAPDE